MFEIHDYNKFISNVKQVKGSGLIELFNPSYEKTNEGIKVLNLDVQGRRKIMAMLERNQHKDLVDLMDIITDLETRKAVGIYKDKRGSYIPSDYRFPKTDLPFSPPFIPIQEPYPRPYVELSKGYPEIKETKKYIYKLSNRSSTISSNTIKRITNNNIYTRNKVKKTRGFS